MMMNPNLMNQQIQLIQQRQLQMQHQHAIEAQRIQMQQNMHAQSPLNSNIGLSGSPNVNMANNSPMGPPGSRTYSYSESSRGKAESVKAAPLLPKKEEPLAHKEWYDPVWKDINELNVLDYFCNRQNPFYDSESINEMRKIQRREDVMDRGFEYKLTYCQPPIMYIISKIERSARGEKTLACYHIIAGKVRQAPDLASIITARLTSSVFHLKNAYDSILEKSRYHPSVGYWWDHEPSSRNRKLEKEKEEDQLANNFQAESTAYILQNLYRKVEDDSRQKAEAESVRSASKIEAGDVNAAAVESSTAVENLDETMEDLPEAKRRKINENIRYWRKKSTFINENV